MNIKRIEVSTHQKKNTTDFGTIQIPYCHIKLENGQNSHVADL